MGVDELYAQLHSPADAGATERAAGAGAEDAPAVLDVRTRGEFAGGRVPGAVNVPLDELSDAVRAGRLDGMRGRPVAVVCAIGKRSAQVAPAACCAALWFSRCPLHPYADLRYLLSDHPVSGNVQVR